MLKGLATLFSLTCNFFWFYFTVFFLRNNEQFKTFKTKIKENLRTIRFKESVLFLLIKKECVFIIF